jgi:S1-C subfamily serine protease
MTVSLVSACTQTPETSRSSPKTVHDSQQGAPTWPRAFPIPQIALLRATGCGPVDRLATAFSAGGTRWLTVAHTLRGANNVTLSKFGDTVEVRVLAIDHRSDIAVLEAEGLGNTLDAGFATPSIAPASLLRWGHLGNPTRSSSVRIEHVAPIDIDEPRDTANYRRSGLVIQLTNISDELPLREREVVSGDSGSPIIDDRGQTFGMVFATDRSAAGKAYAVASDELQRLLDSVATIEPGNEADTGECDL